MKGTLRDVLISAGILLGFALVGLLGSTLKGEIGSSNPTWSYFKNHRRFCTENVVDVVPLAEKRYFAVVTNISCLASFDETVVYMRTTAPRTGEVFGDVVLEAGGRFKPSFFEKERNT